MKLGDASPRPCACHHARGSRLGRTTYARANVVKLGIGNLLFHSYGDVAAEKIRINGVVSQTIAAWNQCSDYATDATGQQLSTDINAWYASWQGFTETGATNYENLPDDSDWSTLQQYETELQALTVRINAYCSAGLPGVNPSGAGTSNQFAMLAGVIMAIGLVVVVVELAPLINVAAEGLDDLLD